MNANDKARNLVNDYKDKGMLKPVADVLVAALEAQGMRPLDHLIAESSEEEFRALLQCGEMSFSNAAVVRTHTAGDFGGIDNDLSVSSGFTEVMFRGPYYLDYVAEMLRGSHFEPVLFSSRNAWRPNLYVSEEEFNQQAKEAVKVMESEG